MRNLCEDAAVLLLKQGESHAWSFNPFAMTCKILITSRFLRHYKNFLRVGIMTSLLKRNLFIERALDATDDRVPITQPLARPRPRPRPARSNNHIKTKGPIQPSSPTAQQLPDSKNRIRRGSSPSPSISHCRSRHTSEQTNSDEQANRATGQAGGEAT